MAVFIIYFIDTVLFLFCQAINNIINSLIHSIKRLWLYNTQLVYVADTDRQRWVRKLRYFCFWSSRLLVRLHI